MSKSLVVAMSVQCIQSCHAAHVVLYVLDVAWMRQVFAHALLPRPVLHWYLQLTAGVCQGIRRDTFSMWYGEPLLGPKPAQC